MSIRCQDTKGAFNTITVTCHPQKVSIYNILRIPFLSCYILSIRRLEVVWRMSWGCQEGFWKVSGRCLEGVWRCWEGGQFLEVIWRVSWKYQNHFVGLDDLECSAGSVFNTSFFVKLQTKLLILLIYPLSLVRYCLEGVWMVSGKCLEGVWRVSRRCPEGTWKVSGRCPDGVWKISGRFLEGIWHESGSWLERVGTVSGQCMEVILKDFGKY